MLIALFTAMYLLLGGATGQTAALTPAAVGQMGDRVEVVVTDPQRAEAAITALGELEDEIKGFEKTFSKSSKGLHKLYEDHEANADQVMSALNELNSEWSQAQMHAIDLRFELKETLTADEWEGLFGQD